MVLINSQFSLSNCAVILSHSLLSTFKSSLSQGAFPDTKKMANIIPVHKKDAKYLVKNYRPIRLLQVLAKGFERYLFDSLFSPIFIIRNYLPNVNQVSSQVTLECPSFLP